MRHGEALTPEKDPQRGLTDSGKIKIKNLATHLKKQVLKFKHVFHSNKKRAQQTAEIMTQILSPKVLPELHDNITPNDDPKLLLTEINNWNEDTLITSHLPYVPNLITLLTGQDTYLSAISFETGTIVCLEKNKDAGWNIIWSTSPSEIGIEN